MKKAAGLLVAAAIVMGGTVACGGGSSSASGDYCSDLKATGTTMTGLQENDITQAKFDDLVSRLDAIKDEAPADIKPSWVIVASAIDKFHDELKSSGMSLDDLAKMQSGSMPNMDMDAVMAAAKSINATSFETAQQKVAAEAKTTCDVDLS
jgi:hypothetical protein